MLINYNSSEASPYLGSDKTLPNSPHLIVVPGTLLSQWEAELKTLFNPKYFKVLLYGTGKAVHDSFWSEDGPFHNTKEQVCANVVIVASHSVSSKIVCHPLYQTNDL
jgi:TATA-binding protein-associated factor